MQEPKQAPINEHLQNKDGTQRWVNLIQIKQLSSKITKHIITLRK